MAESEFLFGSTGEVGASTDGGGLVFDLTDTPEDTGFEVLPKGEYPAIVDELEFGESKSGNPMITVKFKITEGEYENRVLFDYWVLAGKGSEFGLARLKKFLVRVTPEVPLAGFNPAQFAEDAVAIGRECVLEVRVQKQTKGEYKGQMQNRIADIKAPTQGSFI